MENIFIPHRLENESFEQYKERQKFKDKEIKRIKRGTLIWDSREKGQYIKGK